ncbi:MAG: hypothetical protein CVT64_12090 [Actinobacteria bacterium HGW-Actinobacteria-4]|nr:MAG: hypothetical protein CVT64_12090 [Actinobacteria bacterium HGW-Actinobacteria-4]
MARTVVVVAAAVALAGCNGAASPVVTVTVPESPTPTPSASVSTSPTPATTEAPAPEPVTLPAEITANTVDGALAAAHLFAKEYPRILTGGDYGLWDAMSLPGCVFCTEGRALAQAYRDEGVEVRGGQVDVIPGPGEAVIEPDGSAAVMFFATEATLWVAEPGRGESPAFPASESRFIMELKFVDGAWRVSAMEVQRQEI